MDDYLVLQKAVDMSLLNEGMSIPVTFQQIFYQKLGFRLPKGETCKISISIENELYDAVLKNLDFDENKYPGHPDVLQIRYSPSSPIAIRLREIYGKTQEKVEVFRKSRVDKKTQLSIADDEKEYLAIYAILKSTLPAILFEAFLMDATQKRKVSIPPLRKIAVIWN